MSRTPQKDSRPFDWFEVVVVVAIIFVLILFGGEPDLMDAIVARVKGGS